MRTLRLVLEYDGTHFVGWQSQKSGRTVQDALEQALHILLKEPVRLIGAGRTDAGNPRPRTSGSFPDRGHATHVPTAPQPQRPLAPRHCRMHRRRGLRRLPRPLQRNPQALSLSHPSRQGSRQPHPSMDLLSRAISGTYGCSRSLTLRRTLFWAFCKQDPIPEHLTCHIFDAAWSQRGPELIFEIEANRFLRHMVRDPRRHHGRNRSRREAAGSHRRPTRQRRPQRGRCHSSSVRPLPIVGGVPR